MAKLHYCKNDVPVTHQVLKYQETRDYDDYQPIQDYYNEYKEQWYGQLEDYMDRDTFNSEFDFKLSRAVDKFSDTQSKHLAGKYGWTDLGRFNRWFFKVLSNWKSNVKTSAFRLKKRPHIQCPVCNRFVGRIDVPHLEHYKSISDLPKYFVYKGEIFETSAVPRVNAVTWGAKTAAKWRALQKANTKEFAADKQRVEWPWKMKDGTKGVMCPFTKKIVPQITEEYIRKLPDKHSRYAEHVKWEDFIEMYPNSLMQSEIYSLEHSSFETSEGKSSLRENVAADKRSSPASGGFDYQDLCSGNIPSEFEYTFHTIDEMISNDVDRSILKLLAMGYSVEDISGALEIERKEVRRRMRGVRDNGKDLEKLLID